MASIERTTTNSGEVRFKARYRDPAGRSREKRFKRRREAERYIADVENHLRGGTWADPRSVRVRVSEWLDIWLGAQTGLGRKTMASYKSLVHLIDRDLGLVRADHLTEHVVRQWVRSLEEARLSSSRIRQAVNLLGRSFTSAVDSGLIRANPCAGIKRPPLPPTRIKPLEPHEVARLSEAMGPDHGYDLLVLVLAYGGLRFGEAAELRWGDVNQVRRRLEIGRAVTEVGGELVISSTKTRTNRLVHLPDELISCLVERRGESDALVFTSPLGYQLRISNFTRRFKRAAAQAGLGKIRIHDLRHTCASWLIDQGRSALSVKSQLGHADVATTLRNYSHLMSGAEDRLRGSLNTIYESMTAS